MGNERIFIDEDFARVTVRHHVVDKTYQPGPLFPDQVGIIYEYIIRRREYIELIPIPLRSILLTNFQHIM